MKKLLLSAAVVGLLFAVQPAESVAADADGPNASQTCRALNDLGLTHGACVSWLSTGNLTAVIATVCKNPGTQAFYGAKNHGQCVKAIKELIG